MKVECKDCKYYIEGLSMAETINHKFDKCCVYPKIVEIPYRKNICHLYQHKK